MNEESFGKMVLHLFEMLEDAKDFPDWTIPAGASVTFKLKDSDQLYSLELRPISEKEKERPS